MQSFRGRQCRSEPQSDDSYGAPTELVQHFAYRASSHWLKGAASHIIDMVWLCRSPIAVGRKGSFTCSYEYYLP
jgi:hypothetical protein